MARNLEPKCKKCRREGEKLFLRGDRCNTIKCAVVRRKYPPGVHGPKQTMVRLTGYGKQLRAKQKVKRAYGLMERQFGNYFEKAKQKKGDTGEFLIQALEMRLDNLIFRAGFVKSRDAARQLVTHNHFEVNGKKINIPSYQVKAADVVTLSEKSKKSVLFSTIGKVIERVKMPEWLSFDKDKLAVKVLNNPNVNDLKKALEVNLIVEFYSR